MDFKSQIILDQLWRNRLLALRGGNLYAVLDYAASPEIRACVLDGAKDALCLEEGWPRERRRIAPHVVLLRRSERFPAALVEKGWGRNWGIFFVAPKASSIHRLRDHLKNQLRVRLPGGEVVFFRYYDPRILRAFLPSCTRDQLQHFYGPIQEFWTDDEDQEAILRMRYEARQFSTERTTFLDGP